MEMNSFRLLSLYLPKLYMGGKKFSNDEEVKGQVEKCTKGLGKTTSRKASKN